MKINLPNISFEVTSSCNLNCRYCYNHWKCDDEIMSVGNDYKQAIKTLKRIFQIADVKHITFTGGEPLMAERFLELVLYVRMQGATVTVISNGTSADFVAYNQLIELGLSLFELPIHSRNPDVHDYLTRHVGSWEKSVATIKGLLLKKAEVVAVVVLTKANCKDISETLDYIGSLGINRVMINRINIGGEVTKNIEDLLMSRDELTFAYSAASLKAKELKLSITSNVCTPICILNPKDYRGIRFSSCSFDLSKRPITIDTNGDLRFCNHSPITIGNIYKDSLDDVFNSHKVLQWQMVTPDFCNDCKAYNVCKAGCRAASEQMGLSLNHVDPIINYIELDHELLKELKPATCKR